VTTRDFEILYQENFSSVYYYLLKLCQNQYLAEEITSETFFKAIKAIDQFDGKCNLNSWLCQIAKHSYYDYLRKNKRLVEWNRDMEQEDLTMNMEEQLVDSLTIKEISKMVYHLEEPYKKVFILRIFKGLSFKKIACIFDRTENWACVTYHRARNKLKKEWRSKNENFM